MLPVSERQELEALRREVPALRHEIRVLRKKFKEFHRKENGMQKNEREPIQLGTRWKGPIETTIITLVLDEVPKLDSSLMEDINDAKKFAVTVAEERKHSLGYKKIINVYFDGGKWRAKFEL